MSKLLKDNAMKLIEESGLSVRKVERDLGFGYGTIAYWDVHSPSVDKVEKLAAYFGVTVDYLLGNLDNPEEIDFLRMFHDNKELNMLFSVTKDLPKDTISKMIEIAKIMNETGGTP